MQAKREYRDRSDTEVAVLDALVDRRDEGMTVLELRAVVATDIDGLESSLGSLKDDNLITVGREDGEAVIRPVDRVVPDATDAAGDQSVTDWLKDQMPF